VVVITQILTTPGVEFFGPLPPEIQFSTVFTAGVSVDSKAPGGAGADQVPHGTHGPAGHQSSGDGAILKSVTVLDIIGRTRLIPLQHMVPEASARVLVKLEYENPTGSMKDRMALAMVEAAEADGRLRPGGSVVEYTGGSTGVSLAFVCAAKRIPLQIVTSGAFSKEKRDHMTALGARLTLVGSPTGGTTKALRSR
jgi:Pyridoxal-phosphate dependent enzyme